MGDSIMFFLNWVLYEAAALLLFVVGIKLDRHPIWNGAGGAGDWAWARRLHVRHRAPAAGPVSIEPAVKPVIEVRLGHDVDHRV
jgi:hypothetical protein